MDTALPSFVVCVVRAAGRRLDGESILSSKRSAEHRRSYSSRKSERSDHFGESHFSGARHPPNVPRPAQEPSFPSSSQSLGLEVPTLFAHFFSRCDAGRPSHRRWLLGAALSLAAAARGRCAAGLALHHRQRARCCVDFELMACTASASSAVVRVWRRSHQSDGSPLPPGLEALMALEVGALARSDSIAPA